MGQKVRRNGIALSVTAITGLGGPELLEAHARDTAAAFNAMNPEYIGMLTLMVEPVTPLFDWVRDGKFQLLTPEQVLQAHQPQPAPLEAVRADVDAAGNDAADQLRLPDGQQQREDAAV